jgi:DNA-binding CsgD family transcriptional regulator
MSAALFGREEELRKIEALLARAGGGFRGLLLVGEPGIGKTMLLQHGIERASAGGVTVLSCRPVEAEAALAFVGLADLLADRVADILAYVDGPRRRALEFALLLKEPDTSGPDPRALGAALLDVLRGLAASESVLLAVDDLQWLDASSSAALAFALRRLGGEDVGLLATVRAGAGEGTRFVSTSVDELPLRPLSVGALHHLLRERLGLELSRSQLSNFQRMTRGNPFYALEVGRELVRRGTTLMPGVPVPVPATLHELLAGRVARLTSSTREVLLSASALARPTVETLTAAHGGEAVGALEEAVLASVIELDLSRVRFTHPLLAAVCYGEAPPWRRRAAHRALASVVPDVEEKARHLALAAERPDAAIASTVDRAAEFAWARGATAASAELWELAARLTLEADADGGRRRRFHAADAYRLAGDRARAETMLEALLPETPAGAERADVLYTLASTRRASLPAMRAMCEQALNELDEDDARAARILGFLSWARLSAGEVLAALAIAREGLEHAERTGDALLIARAIGRVSMAETWTVDITPGLIERGVELEQRLGRFLEFHESPSVALERRLICQGEFERARPVLEAIVASATEHGDEGTRGHALAHYILLDLFSGRWQEAFTRYHTALELAEQMGDSQFLGHVLLVGSAVELALGRVEQAREAVDRSLASADVAADALVEVWDRSIVGGLELARGDLPAAADQLRELPARMLELGFKDPADYVWPDTIEALAGVGEFELARIYLREFEKSGRKLGSRWTLAIATRCRGVVSAAAGDLDSAFGAFERALAEQEHLTAPYDRARTLLALGSTRRRARQKRGAREPLQTALALFEELGACLWAERTREELARIGGRRMEQELTATELRVAALAAEGRSNKEIATTLFVTPHTVETHLTRIYRKLGVRSRSGLAGRMATVGDSASKV